eukprot:CAMPEP_0174703954 /NCGR_PEP_ID=MMETSP1094-20130205/7722_1 /TAXON_ID=156173 /ORGANISM="Chrysochromulina brevifilum, Strain UTEX LB 985" /LENGTH=223 /DNA_ID=CAMNT_0015901949 /DNA_START=8 /DNA_END=676 /DNA_ORIENTATION=-
MKLLVIALLCLHTGANAFLLGAPHGRLRGVMMSEADKADTSWRRSYSGQQLECLVDAENTAEQEACLEEDLPLQSGKPTLTSAAILAPSAFPVKTSGRAVGSWVNGKWVVKAVNKKFAMDHEECIVQAESLAEQMDCADVTTESVASAPVAAPTTASSATTVNPAATTTTVTTPVTPAPTTTTDAPPVTPTPTTTAVVPPDTAAKLDQPKRKRDQAKELLSAW